MAEQFPVHWTSLQIWNHLKKKDNNCVIYITEMDPSPPNPKLYRFLDDREMLRK